MPQRSFAGQRQGVGIGLRTTDLLEETNPGIIAEIGASMMLLITPALVQTTSTSMSMGAAGVIRAAMTCLMFRGCQATSRPRRHLVKVAFDILRLGVMIVTTQLALLAGWGLLTVMLMIVRSFHHHHRHGSLLLEATAPVFNKALEVTRIWTLSGRHLRLSWSALQQILKR